MRSRARETETQRRRIKRNRGTEQHLPVPPNTRSLSRVICLICGALQCGEAPPTARRHDDASPTLQLHPSASMPIRRVSTLPRWVSRPGKARIDRASQGGPTASPTLPPLPTQPSLQQDTLHVHRSASKLLHDMGLLPHKPHHGARRRSETTYRSPARKDGCHFANRVGLVCGGRDPYGLLREGHGG